MNNHTSLPGLCLVTHSSSFTVITCSQAVTSTFLGYKVRTNVFAVSHVYTAAELPTRVRGKRGAVLNIVTA